MKEINGEDQALEVLTGEKGHLQDKASLKKWYVCKQIYFNSFTRTQCAPSILNLDQKFQDFHAFEVFIYMKEFRISQEKHLSSGFQKSNPQKTSFLY